MVLGFREHFDKAKTKPTYFREKILAGVGMIRWEHKGQWYITDLNKFNSEQKFLGNESNLTPDHKPKIHTIREGHRWKAGDRMHMAYEHRTKNYRQFNKHIPELEFVKGVQSIRIKYYGLTKKNSVHISIDGQILYWGEIHEDGVAPLGNDSMKALYAKNIVKLAINDGFDSSNSFFTWFNRDFSGQIIHFTNLKY